MRRISTSLVVLVTCVTTTPLAAAPLDAPAPRDAGVNAVSAPVPPPPIDCDPPAGVPTWSARTLSTGVLPGPHWLYTMTITQERDRATVVLQEKFADKPPIDKRSWQWRCKSSLVLTGTVEKRQHQLVFHLTDDRKPAEVYELTCTRKQLRVARADAVRIAVRSEQEGCNKHRWSPGTTVLASALSCTTTWEGRPAWLGDQVFASKGPGLEYLVLDEDDCWDPVASLRMVKDRQRVAPVR